MCCDVLWYTESVLLMLNQYYWCCDILWYTDAVMYPDALWCTMLAPTYSLKMQLCTVMLHKKTLEAILHTLVNNDPPKTQYKYKNTIKNTNTNATNSSFKAGQQCKIQLKQTNHHRALYTLQRRNNLSSNHGEGYLLKMFFGKHKSMKVFLVIST